MTRPYLLTKAPCLVLREPQFFHKERYRYLLFGVILQDFVQHQLTVRENIALARGDIDPDQDWLERAARDAKSLKLITALPDGWNTQLPRLLPEQHPRVEQVEERGGGANAGPRSVAVLGSMMTNARPVQSSRRRPVDRWCKPDMLFQRRPEAVGACPPPEIV